MNKFFINHLSDIFTVGKAKDVDVGVAFDMFRTDVSNGAPRNCGNTLPGFDFTAAQSEWDKLGDAGQKQAIEDYDNFIHENYREACVAFAEGREACQKLADGYGV